MNSPERPLHERPTFTQAAGRWGDGIRTVIVLSLILLGLLWPLGVWNGGTRDGMFVWNTSSLIAESVWIGGLLLGVVLALVVKAMQR